MRRDLHNTREYVWALEPDYEGNDMPADHDEFTDRQALEEWEDEMYMSEMLDDDVCPKGT